MEAKSVEAKSVEAKSSGPMLMLRSVCDGLDPVISRIYDDMVEILSGQSGSILAELLRQELTSGSPDDANRPKSFFQVAYMYIIRIIYSMCIICIMCIMYIHVHSSHVHSCAFMYIMCIRCITYIMCNICISPPHVVHILPTRRLSPLRAPAAWRR